MAVLVRCFHPSSFPSCSGVSQRFPLSGPRFPGGLCNPDEMRLLPFRKEKEVVSYVRSHAASVKGQILPSSNSAKSICMAGSKETVGADGNMSDHQEMAPFVLSKAVILANTLILVLPSKVLAETCEADNSFLSMPLLSVVALIGATVGGLLARQRRGELKRLNEQLRQINAALRRQAKIESYAPNLSYAPVGRMPESEIIVDPRKEELIAKLRIGKNHLRNQDPEKAFGEFKAVLELAQTLGDHVEEKKATRGLGASLQRQGKYREAIKYHSKVLEISKRVGEDSGNTEAYGAIADCYTELGDLEQAGKFYDKYIARLESD